MKNDCESLAADPDLENAVDLSERVRQSLSSRLQNCPVGKFVNNGYSLIANLSLYLSVNTTVKWN